MDEDVFSIIQPLLLQKSFPLSREAVAVFENLKSEIASAVVISIDENDIMTVETDVSNFAIGATSLAYGRPIALFSQTLTQSVNTTQQWKISLRHC